MFNLCDNSNLSAKLLKKNTNSKKYRKKHTLSKKNILPLQPITEKYSLLKSNLS